MNEPKWNKEIPSFQGLRDVLGNMKQMNELIKEYYELKRRDLVRLKKEIDKNGSRT